MKNDTLPLTDPYIEVLQHRNNKNLQFILSLINSYKDPDKDFLKYIKSKIYCLSEINNLLNHSLHNYQISLGDFVSDLTKKIFKVYKLGPNVRLKIQINYLQVIEVEYSKALTIGLVIYELLINSYMHAFPAEIQNCHKKKNPEIKLILFKSGDQNHLIISDNGVSQAKHNDCNSEKIHGLKLVKDLLEQINGIYTLDMEDGRTYKITF